MNTPIRRLSVVVAFLFGMLLLAATYVQFVQADELRERPGNRRTLLETYSRDRGAILVDGDAVAESERTDDDLRWLRTYPHGQRYAHVTGYYSFTYGAGAGLESSRNAVLAGTADSLFYARMVDLVTGRPPGGAALELTIDAKVQQAADDALGERRGAVVALDPSTGAILALVSHPAYDPNGLSAHQLGAVQDYWTQLADDPDQPLVNRAIAGDLYPPGSVFKLVVAAAALESQEFQPSTELEGPLTYTLPGTETELPNFEGEPCGPTDQISLADSIRVSCNTSMAYLAGELGADRIRDQAQLFGFGQQLEVPMPVTPSSYPDELNDAQLALTGIGQYDVRVSPLQVAMVSAAIANDGAVMQPYLIDTVRGRDLDPIQRTDPQELDRAVSEQSAQDLTDMMVSVVTDGSGTAAALPGTQVAGKTGTAEFGDSGAAHAWFTGFAPADDPQIAVAVIIESATDDFTGETGGQIAAPVARSVLEAGADR